VWDFDFGTCSGRLVMLKQPKDAPEDFAAWFGLEPHSLAPDASEEVCNSYVIFLKKPRHQCYFC